MLGYRQSAERFLELDGNRDARTASLGDCAGYRLWASGLVVRYSHHFILNNNHIVNTLCGSALEVDGSGGGRHVPSTLIGEKARSGGAFGSGALRFDR